MNKSPSTTRDLVLAYVTAHNDHDTEAVSHLYSPAGMHVEVATGATRSGGAAIGAGLQTFLAAFPDASWTAQSPIVEGRRAAVPYVLRGSLQGRLGPFEPQGQALELHGVFVLEADDEGIAVSADYWDASTFGRMMAPAS